MRVINYDGQIRIAVALNRKSVTWKNKDMLWSDLLEKVSSTRRTSESYKEYLAASKVVQDGIKDVGGFVGGELRGGRRKNDNVLNRCLLSFDIDNASSDFWADFQLLFDCAALVYSTHKHSPEAPRLRLLIPLSRPVMSDEYPAVARRVAGDLGIDLFDPTTFQPARLMYWPSTSSDGEYVFQYQDGKWLDPDEVLSRYTDWTDSSQWPSSAAEADDVNRQIKKAGDPLEKPGIVGAFCRTYSITEVIEKYLSDVYERCDDPNRFTYKHGSTAAGLVVYDDIFAYSHHGTDPVSGKLCNAFDLVRLHLYGDRDEDSREGTPVNKLPSYKEMTELALKDKAVKLALMRERQQELAEDFSTAVEVITPEEVDDSWKAALETDKRGVVLSTINNVVIILENDPWFKGNIYFDELNLCGALRRDVPWRKVTHRSRFITDQDDSALLHYLENVYGCATTKLHLALDVIYQRYRVHPVREYLSGLQWDGEDRLDDLFIMYLGAEDSEYIRAVTRKSLVAAVARAFNPGCKYDYMPVFVGDQGQGKSTLLAKLGGEWFSDSLSTVIGKEAYEQLQGAWLIEMAELAGMRKADVESVKHFLSKREDRYRPAYGRRLEFHPRQCVIFGSTNKLDFLKDTTGNRRFWPVATDSERILYDVHTELDQYDVDQVWAEAVMRYRKNETLYLSKELEAIAKKVQEEHSEKDERASLIEEFINRKVPLNWYDMEVADRRAFLEMGELSEDKMMLRDFISGPEIWCELFGKRESEMDNYNTKFIHEIMRNMPGWKRSKWKKRVPQYGMLTVYERE